MSGREALRDAVVAAVGDALAITVFDAPPVRGALPHAVVEEPVLTDWSTKDWRGHEARFAVVLHDAGERPERLRAMLGAVAPAVEAASLADGWRIAWLRLVRERIARGPGTRWIAASEFVARIYRM